MRTNEPAGHKGSGLLVTNRTPILSGVFAFSEAGGHVVVSIENYHLTQEIGDYNLSVALM
jgi:hypothetical protein